MKKLFALTLVVMLCLMMLNGACAQEHALSYAGSSVCPDALMGHAVVDVNEAENVWTARSYQTDAVLDWFFVTGSRSDSPVVLTVELEGGMQTGVVTPLLCVYHFVGKADAPVTAVSLLFGQTRYDFNVASQTSAYEDKTYEVLTAPLDADTLAVVDLLSGGTAFGVRLFGEEVTTAEFKPKSTLTARRIEIAALEAAPSAKALLEAAGVYGYDLWDLNEAAFEKRTGTEPLSAVTTVQASIGEDTLRDEFGMVTPGSTISAAETAQQMLIDAGFMAGSPLDSFGKRAVRATERAQAHFGLVQTGSMDAVLAGLLLNGRQETPEASAPVMCTLDGVAEVALERWWIAAEARASMAEQTDRVVSNSDHVLIVADGVIKNVSNEPIRFVVDVTAQLVCDGEYAFDAVIVCEGNGGTSLETTMIPQAQARMLAYAEVPGELAQREDAVWTLHISAGDENVVYTLER